MPFNLLRRYAGKPLIWLGLPMLLYVWTLGGPFCFDDLHLVLKTQKYIRGESKELGLFRFAPDQATWDELRSRGNYPWWSPQENRIDFFRPLAEWSFYLDMRLFGANPIGHRVVSLLIFAFALLLLNRLYHEAGGDLVVAGAATLFFGVSQCVTQPVTFVCNRADLFVLIGVATSAIAYLRLRRGDGRSLPLMLLGVVGFGFALAAKETAIAWAGVPLACELFRRWKIEPVQKLCAGFTCVLILVAVGYLSIYAAIRMDSISAGGASGRGALLSQIPRNLPLYLSVWMMGFSINLLLATPNYIAWIVGATGLLVFVAVMPHLVRSLREQFASIFFMSWTGCFLIMALLTNPEVRALSVATVGWAFLLASLLLSRQPEVRIPQLLRHWLFTTNFGISIACAIGIVLISNHAENQARAAIREYLQQLKTPLRDGDVLIVGEPQSPLEVLAAADRLELVSGVKDVSLVFLMYPNLTGDAKRVDNHLIIAGASTGALIDSETLRLSLGRSYVPRVGDIFKTALFEARIDWISNDEIKAMSFHFKRSLADSGLHLVKIE